MATLSKSGIVNGQTVEATHVTQLVDALTGAEAYDLVTSGSITHTGSIAIDSLPDANGASVQDVVISSTTGELMVTSSVAPYTAPDRLVAVTSQDLLLDQIGDRVDLDYLAIGSGTYEFGTSGAYELGAGNIPIVFNNTGTYRISISSRLETPQNNTILHYKLFYNGGLAETIVRSKSDVTSGATLSTDSFWGVYRFTASDEITIQIECFTNNAAAYVKAGTQLEILRLD